MAWATQHRPASLSQLDNVLLREQLEKILSGNQFPHSILLTGPKGTGKTSSARVLAAMLNETGNLDIVKARVLGQISQKKDLQWQEPTASDPLIQSIMRGEAFSVMEVDAASYRGIDAVRSLKDRMALPPTEGLVSVFILDEVHMLTTEAFNALLKMLEEPPAHVVFILATTELQKIPATVISRCLVVQSRQASEPEIVAALTRVLKAEKITFEAEALVKLAQAADGSFRDAVKLMEQALAGSTSLTASQADQALVTTHNSSIEVLISAVLAKDPTAISKTFSQMREQGVDSAAFTHQFFQFLHSQLLIGLGVETGEAVAEAKVLHFILQDLLKVNLTQPSPLPLLPLELALLDLVFRSQRKQAPTSSGSGSARVTSQVNQPATQPVASLQAAPITFSAVEPQTDVVPTLTTSQHANVVPVMDLSSGSAQSLVDAWDDFLNFLKGKNNTLEALLRTSRPKLGTDTSVIIEVHYKFHKDQLLQPKFHAIVAECAKQFAGGSIQLDYEVTAPTQEIRQQQADELESMAKNVLIS